MQISKDSLTIRTAITTDAAQLCSWWNDGTVMAHAGFPHGLGTTPEAVQKSLTDPTDKRKQLLIIEASGQPIGEMSYRTPAEGVAEIGIKICNQSQQGKGLGTLSLRMLIDHLFEQLQYNKIILDTNLQNTRAQHVYEKLGFTKTAIHINSWQDQLNTWQSTIDYALDKSTYHPLPPQGSKGV